MRISDSSPETGATNRVSDQVVAFEFQRVVGCLTAGIPFRYIVFGTTASMI